MNTRLKIHNSGEVEGGFLKCVLRLFLRLHHMASQVLRREVMITVVADCACAPTDGKSCVDRVRGCVVVTFRNARRKTIAGGCWSHTSPHRSNRKEPNEELSLTVR